MAEVEHDLARERHPSPATFSPPKAGRAHPLIELTLVRVREFVREREAVFWVFVFPVLLACALGIAFRNTAPEKIIVAVEDKPGGIEVVEALTGTDIQTRLLSSAEAAQLLRTGNAALVVSVQEARDLGSVTPDRVGGSARFEYRYDPTRPESRIARLRVDDVLQRKLGRSDVAATRDEAVTEPGARYIDFLIPGLVGLNLMGSGMWGLGFTIVQARTRKLLKRLAATPMRRSHYLLSFMLSRLAFLFLEVAAVVVFAWVTFGVAVHGSLVDLAMVSLIGAAAFAGLGLLVAARPKTIEGVSGWMNLVMLPMWLLSGTFFSASRFPDAIQPLIKALPLTALNDALRAVMNEGVPLVSTWSQLAVLVAWGGVSFVIALRIFRWQ
jgi:ABC-type multidrug transport system permease subunit